MEFWFRDKYRLTEYDPRYLEMTPEEMLTDYYAHRYFNNPNDSQEEFEDPDFEAEVKAMMGNPDEWEDLS